MERQDVLDMYSHKLCKWKPGDLVQITYNSEPLAGEHL